MATSTTPAEQSTPLDESLPNAMRAVVQPSYGPAPLLRVEEIERPDIEPNEVPNPDSARFRCHSTPVGSVEKLSIVRSGLLCE